MGHTNKTKQHYPGAKSKTDTRLLNKQGGSNKSLPLVNNHCFNPHNLWRSNSSLDLKPRGRSFKKPHFPLRRIQSASKLEIREKEPSLLDSVVVNYAFFEKYRKKNLKLRHSSSNPRKSSAVVVTAESFGGGEQRSPKPILRKSNRFGFNNDEDKLTLQQDQQHLEDLPAFTSPQSSNNNKKQNANNKKKQETADASTSSPSKETTINGIPLSKIQRQHRAAASNKKQNLKKPNSLKLKQSQTPPKEGASSSPKRSSVKTESPKKSTTGNANNGGIPNGNNSTTSPNAHKTIDDLEKEGARNFARCLLGILPNVLKATEPAAADELIQQFSSDVCEAVTCMTLKRKNVPNFGTVRTLETGSSNGGKASDKPANEEDGDPSLNAECVYKAVYEALKLSYELNQTGFYDKKGGGATPHVSQVNLDYSIWFLKSFF